MFHVSIRYLLEKNRHDRKIPAFMIVHHCKYNLLLEQLEEFEFTSYSGSYYDTMHIPDESGPSLKST